MIAFFCKNNETFAKLVAGVFPTLNMRIINKYGALWATYSKLQTFSPLFPFSLCDNVDLILFPKIKKNDDTSIRNLSVPWW